MADPSSKIKSTTPDAASPGAGHKPASPSKPDAVVAPPKASGGHSANYQAPLPEVAAAPVAGSSLRAVALLAAACVAGGLGWWALHASRGKALASSATAAGGTVSAASAAAPTASASAPDSAKPKLTASGATIVASMRELGKPWDSKKFTFADPASHENVPAMIVRLPGGAANSRAAYWAFALAAPFKDCALTYLADPAQVASQYGYRARHPMVVSACDATVFDPLRTGTVGGGAWVRGEIVSGAGIRPPIAIDIAVQGDNIVADRMEYGAIAAPAPIVR